MLNSKLVLAGVSLAAIVHCVPATAGEIPLYAPPPAWVRLADFDAAKAKNQPLVLLDQQARMEGGLLSVFSDIAYRIDSPEALTKAGTLQLGWLPDKGDLTVHRIEIYRGTERIDLVQQGERYTVLRRERSLEKRSLDGALTATLAVPGLKVGDVVRFSQTLTSRDQALGDAMQFANVLMAQPAKLGFGRVIVSWPKGETMQWRAGPKVDLPPPVESGGYIILTAELPLAKRDEPPKDAPARFTYGPLLQVTNFAGWRDVSRRMAVHFTTDGAIAPGSALDKRVAAIAAASSDPKVRAASALRAVQDEIAYLLNGMNGGNYLPQSPAQTWENRYGDCKAKSLLLLAMLRKMGIDSDVVLVRSNAGDAVASLLPMPSDFDHMIVNARIAGRDYWLDGTDLGTRIDTMEKVPPFAYALPLRTAGADLVPMAQRAPATRDRLTRVTYDYRAGIDMPVIYDATVELRGSLGASIREKAELKDPQERIAFAESVMKDLVGDGLVYETTIGYDPETGLGRVTARGLLNSGFEFERGQGKLALGLPSTGMEFAPDRAKASWQHIPFAVGGPFVSAMDVTLLLPTGSDGMTLGGLGAFDGSAAGIKVRRTSELTADRLHIVDEAVWVPGEIPVADFPQQRAEASRLAAGDPVLKTGLQPVRYWTLDPSTARKRIAALEPAYNAIIALEPKDAWRWSARAKLFAMGPDLKRSLGDWDRAIALEPSADSLSSRSSLKKELGDLTGALADARAAYELEATAPYARRVADILAQQGEGNEALALLDTFDLSGDERIDMMLARADIMGESGRKDDGWALLGEAEGERPGDGKVLNAQCWFMGNWAYRLDSAPEVCDRAVKAGSYASAFLDSRALVHYRLGQRKEALSDLQAALTAVPELTTSLYLRGIMALEDGKAVEGERDIAAATRLYGGIADYFARFGVMKAK